MQKFPVTPIGFECLQRKLYKLPNSELANQAHLIRKDFIAWMSNHFDLNENQISHLESLQSELINLLSSQTSIAIQGRLDIRLLKSEFKPVNAYESKLIKPTSLVRVLASDDDEFEAEGELIIEISY